MSVLHNNPFLLASGNPTDPTFPLQRSLRFRSSSSAILSKTYSTGLSSQKVVFSAWVKRGTLGVARDLLAADSGTAWYSSFLQFTASDQLRCWTYYGVIGTRYGWYTNRVFRDPSAWYHIHLLIDTSISGQQSRRLFINGVEETSFTAEVSGYNSVGMNHYIFSTGTTSLFSSLDGYVAEVNGICGQTILPSSMGGYNSGTGVWEPRKYTGTYGSNDFYLNFQDNSNNTATTIGKDSSGNNNNWTPTGINVSAYTGTPPNNTSYDSMLDVPTITSSNNANFAVANPLDAATSLTISDGNLKLAASASVSKFVRSSFALPASGAYYAEITFANASTSSIGQTIGICTASRSLTAVNNATGAYLFYASALGALISNGTTTGSSLTTISANELFQVAIDVTNSKMWIGRNNVWYNSTGGTTGDPSTGANATFTGSFVDYFIYAGFDTASAVSANFNFGQRPFAGTVPSGYKSLNTFNLPEPTIPRGDKYFKQYLYTGNGGGLQVGEVQKPMSLFNLDRSLRFRSSNSAYLSRTPATAGSRITWTWSGWIKRGTLGVRQDFFGVDNSNKLTFSAADILSTENYNGAGADYYINSTDVYRDPNMWYHVVAIWDSNNATAGDRQRLYVNGKRITGTTGNTIPSGATSVINSATSTSLGRNTAGGFYFDGYMADVYFIDGYAVEPTSFGQYDGNNYWTPKAYTGTYGTNGFHLEFEDFSGTTASTIGKDTSGQGNNWTPSGINLTTPANTNASWDSMVDVPTLTSADVANFCTLNPLSANTATVPTQGNLYLGNNATNNFACVGTLGVSSGKWYWELTPDSGFSQIGITTLSALPANTTLTQTGTFALAVYGANGQKYDNGANTAYGATFTTTNVIGVALDLDAGTLTFYKDGVSQGVAFSGLRGTYYPVLGSPNTYNSGYINFGQRPFKYSNYGVDRPAATFKPINSFNIAEVVGDVETPDLVRIKSRSGTTQAAWFNSVSGEGKYLLGNNSTAIEATDPNSLIQFNKNGLLIGNNTYINTLNATYVADVWKAGSSTVTNTAGSITSQVRANPISGISLVSWTGTGANNPTIGHGLNGVPAFIIAKDRDSNATDVNWWVYHKALAANNYVYLNSSSASSSGALNGWIGTSPSNTTFTIAAGSTSSNNLNELNDRFIAYCFAEIDGFSKFGSYLSNNATDGPFVYTGFRPRWLMIKQRDAGRSWIMYDTTRNTYNIMDKYFFMDGTNNNEQTAALLDVTSNGFKHRSNNLNTNTTANQVYIYVAFAENPFKYALAR